MYYLVSLNHIYFKTLLSLNPNTNMCSVLFIFGLALRTWTNHGNAQVLSKEFLAGTLRLIHELYLNPMNPWTQLYLARVEPEILNMNTVPIPSSSPRGQLHKDYTHTRASLALGY